MSDSSQTFKISQDSVHVCWSMRYCLKDNGEWNIISFKKSWELLKVKKRKENERFDLFFYPCYELQIGHTKLQP